MRRTGFALLLATSSAAAVPAPMRASELARRADLIVEAEVLESECAGPPSDRGDFVSTEYRSELSVTRVIRGTPPSPLTLSGYAIAWKGEQPTGGSPPTPPLPKGWRGTLHLNRLTGGGWVPVWYNAIEEDPKLSRPEPLPACDAKRGCSGCAVPERDASSAAAMLVLVALIALRRSL